jgi:CHAD domain-containing protein
LKKKQLQNIIHKHSRKLKKHIKKAGIYFDEDSIHQFRVSYKELRAFLRMVLLEHPDTEKARMPKYFKQAYRLFGAIRDEQLLKQQLIESSQKEAALSLTDGHFLQEIIFTLQLKWWNFSEKKRMPNFNSNLSKLIPPKFTYHHFKDYLQQKQAAVCIVIASGLFSDADIHFIRKILKDIFYNQKLFKARTNEGAIAYRWMGKDKPYFINLMNDLGYLQDKCTSIRLLNQVLLDNMHLINREQLKRLKAKWMVEKLAFKQQLIQQLTSLIAAPVVLN